MDPGIRSPLLDFFRRGEVARDVRLQAAQGAFAPRALEQLALLVLLSDDSDPEVAREAAATLTRLPEPAVRAFLGRPDVSSEIRAFFAARGLHPDGTDRPGEDPLIEAGDDAEAPGPARDGNPTASQLSSMSVMEKMKVAMRGTREARGLLIRDPNRLVAAAVLSSPKLTETEVEQFAKMANVGEEVLRVIGTNRSWTKNYGVVASLVRNPKTPVAISLTLLRRVNDRDVKMLAIDRNIPEPIRLAARKRTSEARK